MFDEERSREPPSSHTVADARASSARFAPSRVMMSPSGTNTPFVVRAHSVSIIGARPVHIGNQRSHILHDLRYLVLICSRYYHLIRVQSKNAVLSSTRKSPTRENEVTLVQLANRNFNLTDISIPPRCQLNTNHWKHLERVLSPCAINHSVPTTLSN